MEINGGSTASYLARTPCVSVFLLVLINGSGSKGAFRLPGATRDHCRCTVEPLPAHIRSQDGMQSFDRPCIYWQEPRFLLTFWLTIS